MAPYTNPITTDVKPFSAPHHNPPSPQPRTDWSQEPRGPSHVSSMPAPPRTGRHTIVLPTGVVQQFSIADATAMTKAEADLAERMKKKRLEKAETAAESAVKRPRDDDRQANEPVKKTIRLGGSAVLPSVASLVPTPAPARLETTAAAPSHDAAKPLPAGASRKIKLGGLGLVSLQASSQPQSSNAPLGLAQPLATALSPPVAQPLPFTSLKSQPAAAAASVKPQLPTTAPTPQPKAAAKADPGQPSPKPAQLNAPTQKNSPPKLNPPKALSSPPLKSLDHSKTDAKPDQSNPPLPKADQAKSVAKPDPAKPPLPKPDQAKAKPKPQPLKCAPKVPQPQASKPPVEDDFDLDKELEGLEGGGEVDEEEYRKFLDP
jgi:hypothetical protein